MKKITLRDLDHPVVFLFFLSLALIPVMVGVFALANKVSPAAATVPAA